MDISKCPFFSNVAMRLEELDFLLKNDLADVNAGNWEKTMEFNSSQELYKWLCDNKPSEEYAFMTWQEWELRIDGLILHLL